MRGHCIGVIHDSREVVPAFQGSVLFSQLGFWIFQNLVFAREIAVVLVSEVALLHVEIQQFLIEIYKLADTLCKTISFTGVMSEFF